jgi:pyruvate/2-oxoglutarate dehydrogenase complex dihydrolipoamide dehydrogenase (E3) component
MLAWTGPVVCPRTHVLVVSASYAYKLRNSGVRSGTRAADSPGTQGLTVKMTAERDTGRLLGAQILGNEGSAKRIDTAATRCGTT